MYTPFYAQSVSNIFNILKESFRPENIQLYTLSLYKLDNSSNRIFCSKFLVAQNSFGMKNGFGFGKFCNFELTKYFYFTVQYA